MEFKDIGTLAGDVWFTDQDFLVLDKYKSVQSVVRNVILTRRGSLKHNPGFGSELLHSKALNELANSNLLDIAERIKEDVLYSIWLVNPQLQNKIKCDYEIDEENKKITYQVFFQDEDVFVPVELHVGEIHTKVGIKLVFR